MSDSIDVYDGEWVDVTDGTITTCCDCGLVHVQKFTVLEGRILRMLFGDNIRTGYRRRTKRVKNSIADLKESLK